MQEELSDFLKIAYKYGKLKIWKKHLKSILSKKNGIKGR